MFTVMGVRHDFNHIYLTDIAPHSTLEHIWRLCQLRIDEGPYKRYPRVALGKRWQVRVQAIFTLTRFAQPSL